MDAYRPIACGLYDRLEAVAVHQTTVRVVWHDSAGTHESTTRIADVFAEGGADWVRLDTGETVRADGLTSVEAA